MIGKAKESQADIVVELGHVKEAIPFVKQSKELGFSPKPGRSSRGRRRPISRVRSARRPTMSFGKRFGLRPFPTKTPCSAISTLKAYQAKFNEMPTFNSSAAGSETGVTTRVGEFRLGCKRRQDARTGAFRKRRPVPVRS